jgi:hypothetical protein
MGFLTRWYRAIIAAAVVAVGAPAIAGCAAAIPVITKIASVVTDAFLVMDVIDGEVRRFFQANPSFPPELQEKYFTLYRKAMTALNAAQKAVAGAKNLSQDEYDAAFADFKAAYLEILDLLEKNGITQDGTLGLASGEKIELPEPQALTFQVE